MPVLIDLPRWPAHGRLWSHLVSDSSLEELHAFALAQDLPPRSFEGDHYDVPAEHYARLIAAGALPVTGRELVRALRASGLRLPKRRGERVLTSVVTTGGLDPSATPYRRDLLVSPLGAPSATVWSGALVLGGEGSERSVLLVRADRGWALPGDRPRDGESAAQAASRSLVEQTALSLAPSALAPCGLQRRTPVLPSADLKHATWSAVALARLDRLPPVGLGGAWFTVTRARQEVADRPWGPLVDWVVTAR